MTRYLADTTTLIDFSNGIEPVTTRLTDLLRYGEEVGVCAVVTSEFMAGVRPTARARWKAFLQSLLYWETPLEAAIRSGEDRHDLARRGIQIATPDILIAATAQTHGAIIITDNARHYPMPDVTLLSLRSFST
jgi:predicted nucleic acid-binding protein